MQHRKLSLFIALVSFITIGKAEIIRPYTEGPLIDYRDLPSQTPRNNTASPSNSVTANGPAIAQPKPYSNTPSTALPPNTVDVIKTSPPDHLGGSPQQNRSIKQYLGVNY